MGEVVSIGVGEVHGPPSTPGVGSVPPASGAWVTMNERRPVDRDVRLNDLRLGTVLVPKYGPAYRAERIESARGGMIKVWDEDQTLRLHHPADDLVTIRSAG